MNEKTLYEIVENEVMNCGYALDNICMVEFGNGDWCEPWEFFHVVKQPFDESTQFLRHLKIIMSDGSWLEPSRGSGDSLFSFKRLYTASHHCDPDWNDFVLERRWEEVPGE